MNLVYHSSALTSDQGLYFLISSQEDDDDAAEGWSSYLAVHGYMFGVQTVALNSDTAMGIPGPCLK